VGRVALGALSILKQCDLLEDVSMSGEGLSLCDPQEGVAPTLLGGISASLWIGMARK
jgi:hypothetical protein